MSGQSSGQTTQESTPLYLPNPSSLTDDIDASAETTRGATPTNSHSNYTKSRDYLDEDVVVAHDEASHRRHKPRNSGGFLLQGTHASTTNPTRSRHIEPEISENARGKRKAVEGVVHVPKRGTTHHRHRQRTSLGSSPLATEVVNLQSAHHREGSGASASNRQSSEQSTKAHSTRSGLTSNGTPTESTSMMGETAQNIGRGAIGMDTDPAQIINLALNLSESRRRNVSSGGLFAPRDVLGARRLISPVPPTLSLPNNTGAGGSLRQHLQQQRRASRNLSPRSSRSIGGRGSDALAAQKEKSVRQQPTSFPDFETGLNEDIVFKASNATLSRAEKARVTFELSYEYRRLLQYLPVLPVPVNDRTTTSKNMRSRTYPAQVLGRVYNPLQYIRNRKLRIREREPLDAEGNGWNNIEHVRAWVDEVINQREDGISRVDKRFPLPPFEQSPSGPPQINDLQAQNSSHPLDPQAKRPGRPHMDWIVTPWDLLADANWLHQDDNVKRIVDRERQPLIPRGDPHHEDRPNASMDSTRGPVRGPESLLRHINSSPERLRASLESFRSDSKDRGRRRLEEREPKSPVSDNDSFQRKSRWPKKLMRSRSSSSSGEFHHARKHRHKRGRDHLGSRDDIDDAAYEKQMMGILAKEAKDKPEAVERVDHLAIADVETKPSQSDRSKADGKPAQPAQHRPSTPQRMKTDMPATDKYTSPARASLDEQRLYHYRMSSDDFDSTVPNSPTTPGFIPSIAINLSPPESPQAAIESPLKRTLSGRIGSFRRNRSQSVNRRAVSENTGVIDSGTSTDVSRQTTSDSQPHNMLLKERSMHLGNGFLSPTKADSAANRHRPLENKSLRSIKDTGGLDSRFKGFFKSGRIAEIVGNEVSRVGDMLWKKDSNNISDMHSEVSSLAPDESDIDEGDVSGVENSPVGNLSRVTTTTEGTSKLSRASTNSERPKYHISNLPSFRSPFNKDEQTPRSTRSSPEHDHITRQQIALRERGRSSRFDRLAPPKIDMRGISPSPSRSPSLERQNLRVTLDDDTGEGSRSRSAKRVRSADKRLNAILAIPGSISGGSASSGLAGLESRPGNINERPRMEGKRQWSIADRGVSTAQEAITKRDIARVRALLLSSGVKANEIARRAEEIPGQPSPILLDLIDLFKGSIPEVPKSKEHVIAARILVSTIDTTTQRLRYSAEQFSRKTVESLHDQIKAIDERVTYKFTPLVRDSADDADNLSTELTTTHTLAVKQLNDSIDGILRRRRRRLRWIRRGGWAMLEWTLLVGLGRLSFEKSRKLSNSSQFELQSLLLGAERAMLRQALPLARQSVRISIGSAAKTQWRASRQNPKTLKRSYADSKPLDPNTKPSIHDSDTVVLPGTASTTAKSPQPPPPGPVLSASPTAHPIRPSSDNPIPQQSAPLIPPTPPGGKVQTAPPTSIPPTQGVRPNPAATPPDGTTLEKGAPPPPTPPQPPAKRKSRWFRRTLQTLVILTILGYAGGTYYSLLSDNFHDFFTEYVPFGEEAVLYFEEREFRKRFPSLTNPTNRPPPDTSNKITIPSRSGVSWKVAGEEHQSSDLQTKGKHMSALDANKDGPAKAEHAQQTPSGATGLEKTKAVEQAKKEAPPAPKPKPAEEKPKLAASPPPPKEPEKPAPKPEPKTAQRPKEGANKPPEVNEPSRVMPIQPIDPLKIRNADEPLVQDLVKIVNDIITVVNEDSPHKYSSTIGKAKSELANVGSRIISLKQAEKEAAQEKINSTQREFDTAAKELVRRLEEEMKDQEGRWKDEFESEREKISSSYQERLQTETKRAQQVFEQRRRNELLEQALAMKKQFMSEVTDRVETERNGRLSKLSNLSASVSELEKLTADWNSVIDANLKTQHLQVAFEAVRSSLENTDRPRPFIKELAALKEIASDDPVVSAAIGSINPTAYQRGVPTTAQLIDRFRRVATEVRKASLLPENAGVASHAASFVLSKFLFKKKGMTVGDDVESVLTRTETLLEEGNLDEAVREMNTLEGWAKTLSWDWLNECRRVLEVRQAMDVIATEARLEGLKVD